MIRLAEAGGHAVLSVGDDGIGIPDSVDFDNTSGFGFRPIKGLAEQLGGSIRVQRAGGTTFTLEFEARGKGTGRD